MDDQELRHRFKYHPPKDDGVKAQHEEVREHCTELAEWINVKLPEGREKSLVITHLEEAMMWANAAIARHQGK